MYALILDIRRTEELSLLKPPDDPKKKKKKDKAKEMEDDVIDMDVIGGTGNTAFTSFQEWPMNHNIDSKYSSGLFMYHLILEDQK